MSNFIPNLVPYYGWIGIVYFFTFMRCVEFIKQRTEREKQIEFIKIIKSNKSREPLHVYVLRPLKGYKSYFEHTLRLENDNPLFILHNIFIMDEDDPGLNDLNKMKFEVTDTTKYSLFIKLFNSNKVKLAPGDLDIQQSDISDYKHYINHKIQSLTSCIDHYKVHGFIWNLDDNVFINNDTLNTTLMKIEQKHWLNGKWLPLPQIGDAHCTLWHHVCLGIHASQSALLEAMFLNTLHSVYYIFINLTRIDSCLMGKSIIFPSTLLEHKDIDLHVYQDILAEDNAFGQAVWKQNVPHEMIGFAYNVLGKMSVKDVIARRIRWARLRKYNVPIGNIIEPFTEPCLTGLLVFGVYGLEQAVTFLAIWLILDGIFYFSTMPSASYLLPLKRPIFVEKNECASALEFYVKNCLYFVIWWTYRTLMAPYIYLTAMWDDDVEWRGREYLLLMNGKVQLKSKSPVVVAVNKENKVIENGLIHRK